MKFFIDTANLAQIKEAHELGILDGVTTNPSLMAKEGIRGEEAINQHYKTICEMVDGDISAEVLTTDLATIIEEGKKLAAIHPNIVVKVPMTQAALGTEINIPTLEAELDDTADEDASVTVDVPSGTQSGTRIAMADRGVPKLRGRGRGEEAGRR